MNLVRPKLLMPLRPVDFAIVAAILYLPVAPFIINTVSPVGSFVRFAIAAAVPLLMLAGAIPIRRPLLGNGRWLIAAFALFQLVPLIMAAMGQYGLFYGFVRAANWVMFIPFAFIEYDARSRRIAFAAATVVGLVLAVGVGLQLAGLMSGTWGGLPLSDGTHIRRYTSFLLSPNDLALLMLGIGATLYLVSQRRRFSLGARLVGLFGVSLCATIVLLTSSRGALLAFPLILIFLILAGDVRSMLGVTITALLTSLLIMVFIPPLRAPVETTFRSVLAIVKAEDPSGSMRQETWATRVDDSEKADEAREDAKEGDEVREDAKEGDEVREDAEAAQSAERAPVAGERVYPLIIGRGYGGYYTEGQEFDIRNAKERAQFYKFSTVDNGWLKLWLEEGAIGVGLFSLILAGGVWRCFALRSTKHRIVGLVVGSLLIVLAFRALSVDIFDINPFNFFLWFLLGISYVTSEGTADARSLETHP